MKRDNMRIWLSLALCFLVSGLSCNRSANRGVSANEMEAESLSRLADSIIVLSRLIPLFETVNNADDLFFELSNNGVLSAMECSTLASDEWGNKLSISIDAKERTVRLVSAGGNGTFEDGNCDDLYAFVSIPPQGSPTVSYRILTNSRALTFVRRY